MFAFVEAARPIVADAWPVIERFVAEPVGFLPPPAHPVEDRRWRTTVRTGRFHHEVILDVGPVWTMPDAWVRPITWTPIRPGGRTGHRLLPDLSGRVALRQDDELRLEVTGHYTPPLGVVGAALDQWQLRQLAQDTLERFAEDLSQHLAATRTVPADR